MIEAIGLYKRFGEVLAVRDATFSAAKGEVVGFLGPNGAGKTTTLRMLTTFLAPTGGTAKIAGFDIAQNSAEVRKQIGYLPETPPLYNELTVQEYLTFAAKVRGVQKKLLKGAVENVIERCSLTEMRKRLCGSLSKGYRQRVGLAQALVHSPRVVILDEPTSALDPQQIIQVRELIASLKENHTVILSTHILPEVVATCTKVVLINDGKVVLSESLDTLLQRSSLEEVFLHYVAGESGEQEE